MLSLCHFNCSIVLCCIFPDIHMIYYAFFVIFLIFSSSSEKNKYNESDIFFRTTSLPQKFYLFFNIGKEGKGILLGFFHFFHVFMCTSVRLCAPPPKEKLWINVKYRQVYCRCGYRASSLQFQDLKNYSEAEGDYIHHKCSGLRCPLLARGLWYNA